MGVATAFPCQSRFFATFPERFKNAAIKWLTIKLKCGICVITNSVIFSARQHIGVYTVLYGPMLYASYTRTDIQTYIYVCMSVRHTGGSL